MIINVIGNKKDIVLDGKLLAGINTVLPTAMHVREFTQNTFDNFNENATLNKNNYTYLLPVFVDGYKKFCIADNGSGITHDVFFNDVLRIGNSKKVDNFCWGGNISTAKNNKKGVLYITRAIDGFHCYIIVKENKKLVGFEISSEVIESLSGDAFNDVYNKIKKFNHGTMVVFLGNDDSDNTCIGIQKNDENNYRASASKFVSSRFGTFPQNTQVCSYPLDGKENAEWKHRKLMTNNESFQKFCDKKHSFKVKNGKYSAIVELGYIKQSPNGGNSGHNFCESGLYIIENKNNEVIQHYAYNRGGSGINNDKINWRVIGEEYFGINEVQSKFIVRLIIDCKNVEQNVFRNGFEDENGDPIEFIDVFSEEVKKKLPDDYIELFGILNKKKKEFNNNQNRKNMNDRINNTMETMNFLSFIDNGEPISFCAKSLKFPRDSEYGEGEGLGKNERNAKADGRGIGQSNYGDGEKKDIKKPRNSKKIKTKKCGETNNNTNTVGEMLPEFNASPRGNEYPMLEFKKSSINCPFGEIRMNTTSEEVLFYLSKIRKDKIDCQIELTDEEIMEDIQERFEEITKEMFISTISLEAKRQQKKFKPEQLSIEASKKLTPDAFYDVFMLQTTEHFKAIRAKSKSRKSNKTKNNSDETQEIAA